MRQQKLPISTFLIISQWKLLSCHSNQSSYLIGTKNIIRSPPPSIDAICEIWKESASQLQRSCCLKMLMDGRTDGRQMPAYTISSPMLSWAKNTIYVEANVMNRYAKFQLHPLDDFWEEDFWRFFRKLTLYVAMATNQIQWFGQNSYES